MRAKFYCPICEGEVVEYTNGRHAFWIHRTQTLSSDACFDISNEAIYWAHIKGLGYTLSIADNSIQNVLAFEGDDPSVEEISPFNVEIIEVLK
jgi:hypothetical protein